MKNNVFSLLWVILLAVIVFAPGSTAQTPAPAGQPESQSPVQFASGTVIPAELSKSVDAKKAKVGDPVEAKTAADMLSNGKIVMPRNTRILGHVTSVKAHSKDSPDSMLGIAFDRLVMKDGSELPLQVSVQAIGSPINAFAGSSVAGRRDPDAPVGPMGGTGGSSAGGMGAPRTGGASPTSSYPSGSIPTAADGTAPQGSSTGALSASSQGVVGIKDLSLSAAPQASVVSSSTKNVHLDGGTQLMLKVQ
jgi:hypothetical protein